MEFCLALVMFYFSRDLTNITGERTVKSHSKEWDWTLDSICNSCTLFFFSCEGEFVKECWGIAQSFMPCLVLLQRMLVTKQLEEKFKELSTHWHEVGGERQSRLRGRPGRTLGWGVGQGEHGITKERDVTRQEWSCFCFSNLQTFGLDTPMLISTLRLKSAEFRQIILSETRVGEWWQVLWERLHKQAL